MNRTSVIAIGVVALAAGAWLLTRRAPALAEAYAAERKVSVWNRVAQVREPLATLAYGERVEILERRKENVRVRTAAGVEGWLDERRLMPAALWHRGLEVRRQAASLHSQARGSAKVPTNVRVEPGRNGARLYQFAADTRVEVLARRVVEWTPDVPSMAPGESTAEGGKPDSAAAEDDAPMTRREDWLLVRGTGADGEIAGWVVGRFLALDFPAPLRDLAPGLRFLAWHALTATPSPEGPRPTWLALGVEGPEGQACDFTLLRVYTWSPKRSRYETAYVEGNLCGRLPVEVKTSADLTREAAFRFVNLARRGEESREYYTRHNVVRRVAGRK